MRRVKTQVIGCLSDKAISVAGPHVSHVLPVDIQQLPVCASCRMKLKTHMFKF